MTDRTTTTCADVTTERPGRYGKQLVSHLSRRSVGSWDDDSALGTIEFSKAHAALSCFDDHLHIELTAAPEDLDQMEDVVGRHLVRFGTRDELTVAWVRDDGTRGTQQRHLGESSQDR